MSRYEGLQQSLSATSALLRMGVDARWKRNVRNVLQRRKSTGEVQWDGSASYRLASCSRSE